MRCAVPSTLCLWLLVIPTAPSPQPSFGPTNAFDQCRRSGLLLNWATSTKLFLFLTGPSTHISSIDSSRAVATRFSSTFPFSPSPLRAQATQLSSAYHSDSGHAARDGKATSFDPPTACTQLTRAALYPSAPVARQTCRSLALPVPPSPQARRRRESTRPIAYADSWPGQRPCAVDLEHRPPTPASLSRSRGK